MIVECSECQTRFQLDDARVPASGIRVRCSRCKHAFFLKPPGADTPEAIHEVAREAAAAGAVPPPGSTQDLSSPQVQGPSRSAGEAEEDEAGDWEFNEEVPDPVQEDDLSAGSADEPEDTGADSIALDGEDDLDDLGGDDFDHEFGAEDLEREDLEAAEAPFEAADPVADPVAVDGSPATAGSVPGSAVGETGSPDRDESAFGSVEEMGDLGAGDAASESRSDGDDLEDWDFFGGDSPSAPHVHEAPIAPETTPATSFDATSTQEAGAPTGLDSLSDSVRSESRLTSWLRACGHAVGWVVVMGLFGVGVTRGLWPGGSPLAPSSAALTPSRPMGAGLDASAVEAFWLDSARLGRLLVVTGELQAAPSRTSVPVGGMELTLLDAEGHTLPDLAVPLGLPLEPAELRESGPEALEASRRTAADRLSTLSLPPGGRVRFQAVLPAVPLEAERFDIRAIDPVRAGGGAVQPSDATANADAPSVAGSGDEVASESAGQADGMESVDTPAP
ncbi:MAG: zinc-ribbon domain-containing protein [Myxococcota bacterium]